MEAPIPTLSPQLLQDLFLLKREPVVAKVNAVFDGKIKELCLRTRFPARRTSGRIKFSSRTPSWASMQHAASTYRSRVQRTTPSSKCIPSTTSRTALTKRRMAARFIGDAAINVMPLTDCVGIAIALNLNIQPQP